jgi:hypothetical protein
MKMPFSQSGLTVELPEESYSLANAYGSEQMDSHELLYLAAALASYRWDIGGIVVEIGAYKGRTTVYMAKTLSLLGESIPILSIDPFERARPDPLNPQGKYKSYLETIAGSGLESICLPLVGFSADAAPVVPDNIGLLVIDGGHEYEVVDGDFALYGPKIRSGGLIFLDDYIPAYPGVMRAADEFFESDTQYSILHQSYFIIAQRSQI